MQWAYHTQNVLPEKYQISTICITDAGVKCVCNYIIALSVQSAPQWPVSVLLGQHHLLSFPYTRNTGDVTKCSQWQERVLSHVGGHSHNVITRDTLYRHREKWHNERSHTDTHTHTHTHTGHTNHFAQLLSWYPHVLSQDLSTSERLINFKHDCCMTCVPSNSLCTYIATCSNWWCYSPADILKVDKTRLEVHH